jgi:glycosyltransferase involved in cell wall biosynthesis
MKRIAFVDLMFSWPPHGGGCIDLKQTATELGRLGHDVHLFVPDFKEAWQRGSVDSSTLEFQVHRVPISLAGFNMWHLPKAFRQAVDTVSPDIVWLGDSYFLKPYLVKAFRDLPIIARFYTYEIHCPDYYALFRNGGVCDTHYLKTPARCMLCATRSMRGPIVRWKHDVWSHEFMAALAFRPGYYRAVRQALDWCNLIIVYNKLAKSLFDPYHDHVVVVPGGVNLDEFPYEPLAEKGTDETKYILMTGRAGDPRKGVPTLVKAAEILATERQDFRVWITHDDATLGAQFVEAVGWRAHSELAELYAAADICTVPSVWHEPFGMVALEAMATGRPVVASKVGGLVESVVDGETGFHALPDDPQSWADKLGRLLDNPKLRIEMGRNGRQRVESHYTWQAVVRKYYPPLLDDERLLRGGVK